MNRGPDYLLSVSMPCIIFYRQGVCMKKIIFAGLILLMATALFAGGSKDLGPSSTVINMVAPSLGPIQKGIPEVEAAVNAIIEPVINARIKITSIEVGSYSDQVNLMMSSGEKMDLVLTIPAGSAGFNSMISQNQLADISGPIAQYGQDMVRAINEIIPGFLDGTTVNERILGVSGLYNKVSSDYWCIRNDLIKKHNINVSNVRSLDDMERILEQMRRAEPTMSPLVPSSRDGAIVTQPGIFYQNYFENPVLYDHVGDQVNRLAIALIGDPNAIVNSYKTDAYKTVLRRMHSWYEKGYIYKDASINTEMGEELVKSGKGFSWVSESELGVESNKSSQTGYEIVAIKLADTVISTANLRKFVWAVPSTSREAAAAVKFLNLMYTDARIVNLLTWGIEGRDYEAKTNGTIGYPAGINAGNVPYHAADFLFGNQYLAKVWEGDSADLRERVKRLNQQAPRSPLLGFSFDNSTIINEMSAIINLVDQYRPGLESGTTDPERELAAFIRDLDAAGAQKVVDEVQKQLNAWRSAR
jgi:putative aldouronate transport system substrate-binding protein